MSLCKIRPAPFNEKFLNSLYQIMHIIHSVFIFYYRRLHEQYACTRTLCNPKYKNIMEINKIK